MKKVVALAAALMSAQLFAQGWDLTGGGSKQFDYIRASGGLYNAYYTYFDLPAPSTWNVYAGFRISSAALIYSGVSTRVVCGTDFLKGFNYRTYRTTGAARNLVAYTTFTIHAGQIIVRGIDQFGNWTSETLRYGPGYAVRVATGNVCWMYVSSITLAITSMTYVVGDANGDVRFDFGFGDRVGLGHDIRAVDDVMLVQINDVPASLAGQVINTTYDYIVFSDTPNDANDYTIFLRAQGCGRYAK